MTSHFAVAYTAIEERRRALAAAASFSDGHDWMIQRGIDEALACSDMLEPAPRQRSRFARLWAHLTGIIRSLVPHKPAAEDHVVHAMSTDTHPQVTWRPME
jgi:hypothetical protein